MKALTALLCALALSLTCGVGLARTETVQPVEGGWRGRSHQGFAVYFGVREGRVVNTRFRFFWPVCGPHTWHRRNASVEIDPSGHWVAEEVNGVTLEGTFVAPDRVEGRIVAQERELPSCPATKTRFVAAPRTR